MSRKFSLLEGEVLDTNVISASTTVLTVQENTVVAVQVVAVTGDHAVHVTALQCSMDKINWFNVTGGACDQIAIADQIAIGAARYVKVIVSTAEGTTSTSRIYIGAK